MKRTLLSIIGILSLLGPVAASANSIRVKPHDDLLDISGRNARGTLQADVERSQSFYLYNAEYCASVPDNVGPGVSEDDVRGCRDWRRRSKTNMEQLVSPSKSFLAQLACFLSGGTSNRCTEAPKPELQTATR